MKAARIHEYGDPDVFRIDDIEPPTVRPRDVLIEVHAAGVNPVDYKIRSGSQRAVVRLRLPAVLGLDVSGIVVEVGSEVAEFAIGDAVFSSPTHRRQGTYAELVAIDEAEIARKPARISHIEAASIPLVGLTVWQCLVDIAKLSEGQRVFIQAGAGGVGSFAIQLAKHLGATVATTCSERNVELVERLGASVVIDYNRQEFEDVLSDYDVVLESMGREHKQRARRVLRRGGRMVYIQTGLPELAKRYGPTLGAIAVGFGIAGFALSSWFMGKRANVVVRKPDGKRLEQIAELLESGVILPIVEDTFPLEQIAEAHRAIETGRTRGKLVIDLKARG